MDMGRLQKLNDTCWTVPMAPGERRGPVLLYGSEPLLAGMDDKVLEQITNVAKLPGLVGAAMTMPDAHWGYGFPIGGVAAFDADQGGIISAGGVGFDISCGIRTLRSNLMLHEVDGKLEALADALYHRIPAGVGEEGELKLSTAELDAVLLEGAEWAVRHATGTPRTWNTLKNAGAWAAPFRSPFQTWPSGANAGRWGLWDRATITWKYKWWTASMKPRRPPPTACRKANW